jgi:hypothetical protein
MDVGKSIGYVFEDKKWTNKILLGILVSIIPIVNFAYLGYLTVIMKNVTEHQPEPLPEWSNFGDKFVKGLILTLALLIYSLPALILLCPFTFLPFLRNVGSEGRNAVTGLFVGTALLLTCLLTIYGLIISFLAPAINLNFARKNTFGACFEFGEIWRIMSKNLSDYIVAWLITVVIAIGASFVVGIVAGVLFIIPCIGWLIGWVLVAGTSVWIGTVYAHLFGQIGSEPPGQAIVPGA